MTVFVIKYKKLEQRTTHCCIKATEPVRKL